jgi:hypothetical protein
MAGDQPGLCRRSINLFHSSIASDAHRAVRGPMPALGMALVLLDVLIAGTHSQT